MTLPGSNAVDSENERSYESFYIIKSVTAVAGWDEVKLT